LEQLLSTLKTKWFLYSTLCLLCFAAYVLVSKLGLNYKIPDPTMYYLFIWGSVPVALALLAARSFRMEKSAKGISLGTCVGILGGIGQWAILIAWAVEGANTSVIAALTGLYPMLTAVLAVWFLRERLLTVQIGGLILASVAIVIFGYDPKNPFSFSWLGSSKVPAWYLPSAAVLLAWGVVGIFQKLATNHISAESTMIWQTLGFCLFLPFFVPAESLTSYATAGLIYGLLGGALTNLGSWFLFAAFKNDGKASVVTPFTALYPLVVVFFAPFVLRESVTLLQGMGVVLALAAIVMLSIEQKKGEKGK
jgi:transporter family protein